MSQKQSFCVMQVLPTLESGGVETGTIDIAKALLQKGHRAIVVSAGGQMVSQLDDIGASHIKLPVQSKNPWIIWRNAQILKELIQTENIDIVHARSRAPAWSCYWATKNNHTPYITTFHGAYGHQNRLKRWYNSAMLRSNITIAVSNFIASHIQAVYADFQKHVQVILRGIDTHQFNPDKTQTATVEQLKKRWKIPTEHIVMMLPGRLTRLKGHAVFIEAAAKLEQQNITYLIVGDEAGKESYKAELQKLTQTLQLSDQIRFIGACSDMPSAYQVADIVVSASTKPEAFGRIACEAQAMSCLVIASNHGGSQETIAPCQQAFMCQPGSIESMTTAMKAALSTTPEQANNIFRESRSYIYENFSLDKMAADTLSLYALQLKCPPPTRQGSPNAEH